MSFTSLIAASGVALGLLIALALLLTRGGRAYANRVLALGVLVSTTYLAAMVWRRSFDLEYSLVLHLGSLVGVLYGPAIYLYVRVVTDPGFRLSRRHFVHLLPYALFVLVGSGLFPEHFLYRNRYPFGVLFYLLLNAYLAACLYQLYRYQRRIVERYASLEGISLRWLATLVCTIALLAVLGLCFAIGRWLFDAVAWPQQMWSVSWMVAISYLIAFFAILRPTVFNPDLSPPVTAGENGPGAADAVPEPARYQTSSLTDSAMEEIWAMLETRMREARPYLEPQLKIADLAQAVDLPQAHLSQTINQRGGCTFFNYVNRYRVDYAKELLRSFAAGERTMLDVALSSGFNSESAFYKQFRSRVGKTPREYQRQN